MENLQYFTCFKLANSRSGIKYHARDSNNLFCFIFLNAKSWIYILFAVDSFGCSFWDLRCYPILLSQELITDFPFHHSGGHQSISRSI